MLLDDCICLGQNITYECTVCGEGPTVWNGSLFQCTAGEIILRRHPATGECSYGTIDISAKSIGQGEFNGNTSLTCYTSQLTLQNITSIVNNNTVTCLHLYETSLRVVGRTSVHLTTGIINYVQIKIKTNAISCQFIIILYSKKLLMHVCMPIYYIADPGPPPTNIYLSEISPMHLMLSWNSLSASSCSSLNYIVYAIGDCSAFPHKTMYTNTTITYTNLTTVSKNCSVFLQTELCESILGAMSNPFAVTLKGK